jgi:hypothetical protein
MSSYNYGKLSYRKLNELCTLPCNNAITSNTKFLSPTYEGYLKPCEPDIPPHLYTYKTDPRFPTRIVNYIGKDSQPDGLNSDVDGFPITLYRKPIAPPIIRD